jgi:hypothetical protein
MKNYSDIKEIKEMVVSLAAVFFAVFFAVLCLTDIATAFKLSFFYCMLFYLPFLPLAYSFKELGSIEKAFVSNILGIGYIGIYATFDVFLKIKLVLSTYLIGTVILQSLSCWFYANSKH